MKKIKNDSPLEAWEQEQIFKWRLENVEEYPKLRLLNASLCGVRLAVGLRSKMKRQGMPKGFPDINLPIAVHVAGFPHRYYHGLYIELKRLKGGFVSKEQKWWHKELREQGYKVEVAKGHKQAIEIIVDYLDLWVKF